MSYPVYIDYPTDPSTYVFLPGEQLGNEVVSRKLGVRVSFVCNALAMISMGDVYEVLFDQPEDATAFVLKCEYPLIDKDKVEQYRRTRYIEKIIKGLRRVLLFWLKFLLD